MITTTVNFDTFYTWLQNKNSSYYHYFSYEGAKALFEYLDDLSDELDDRTDNYDPVAWCVGFSEYDNLVQAYNQYHGDESDLPAEQQRTTNDQILEYFEDNTTVIECDNGHVVIEDF